MWFLTDGRPGPLVSMVRCYLVTMENDGRWSAATWEGAAEESLLVGTRLTMAERLAWLQEIRRLSDHIEARRAATTQTSSTATSDRPRSS